MLKSLLRVLHTPGKRSAYKPVLLNYLMTWTFSMCLTWNWLPEKFNLGVKKIIFLILWLFMKIKVPTVFKLGTCESVSWSYIHCTTGIDIKILRYKLFYNALKSPCCDVLASCHKSRRKGFEDPWRIIL